MTRVLFICHGNICRSPMAECIFDHMIKTAGLEDRISADSAATSREEIGNGLYPPARACLKAHGIPAGGHRARQITAADLQDFDYIICMERYNLRNLERLLGPSDKVSLLLDHTDQPGDIPDPWYTGEFEVVYSMIEKGCRGLLEELRGR